MRIMTRFCRILRTYSSSTANRAEALLQRIIEDTTTHQQVNEKKLDLILHRINKLPQHDSTPTAGLVNKAGCDIITEQFQWARGPACDRDCGCVCHLRPRSGWRSPADLRQLLGLISLNYSGLIGASLMKPACNLRRCKSRSSCVFTVTYCFPGWFVMKTAHFISRRTPYGEIHVMPFLQRRTAEFAMNSIYHIAKSGNIPVLEKLLKTRQAMPNDAADLNGCTALHVSLGRISVIKS